MHWKNLIDNPYMGAYSLEGVESITVTIKDIAKMKVTGEGGKSDEKLVCLFEEDKQEIDGVLIKPMILNATNCKTIESIYETGDVDKWIGKKITLFVGQDHGFGTKEMVDCLRIKREKPAEEHYCCSVCGQEISYKTYKGSIEKYGIALCSKECKEKYEEQNAQQGGEN